MSRRLLAPLALLGLTVFLFSGVLFSNGQRVAGAPGGDMSARNLPLRDFGFGELRRGNLALWNPLIFSGLPNLGGFESALLYPPNWVHLFLPLGVAVNVTVALHVFLAGLFTFLWALQRGHSRPASALAGVVFMLGGPFFLHVYAGHLAFLCAMAWMPLLFLSLDGWFATGRPGWCALGMIAAAMQILAGSPQHVYDTALAAGCYALLNLPGARAKGRLIAGLAAIYGGAAALSAVQLLTGLQAASESVRSGGLPYKIAATWSLPPESMATLVAPNVFGDAVGFVYFGRFYMWETSLFVGAGAAVLAVIGAACGKRRPARIASAMVLILLALALGAYTPLHRILYLVLPGFNRFRGAAKFSSLLLMFVAVLAAAGLDWLLAQRKWPRRAALSAALAGLAFFALGVAIFHRPGELWGPVLSALGASGETRYDPALYAGADFIQRTGAYAARQFMNAGWTLLAVSGLLALMAVDRRSVWGLGLLACAELVHFAARTVVTIPVAAPYPAAWSQVLNDDPGDYRVLEDWTLHPNAAMALGRQELWGYDQLVTRRYAEFIAFTQGGDPDSAGVYQAVSRASPLLRLLRCRYQFLDTPQPAVRRLPGDLPRLLLIDQWAQAEGRDAVFRALSQSSFDPARRVVLEEAPVPRPEPGGAAGRVSLVRSGTDGMEVEADLPKPAILLITDNYSPGWRAVALAGSVQPRYEVLPADYTLRAVPLEAGRHHFRLEYSPLAFRLGAWISLISAIVYVGWMSLLRRRRPLAF